MARIKGQANYASNFEVLKQAPLDSRSVVSDSGDLIKAVTWRDADGNVWLYDGLIVVVPNTNNPSAPEVYVLKDKDNYGHPDTWFKLGADNASAVAAIQEILKKKANLVNGKVSANELPIATSLGNPNNGTIPTTFAVNEAINNKIVGLLNWQGVKDTTDEIKAIAPAKKGDVWHSNEDGSEWVCTQDITAANADAWTELGTPVNLSGYYTKTEVDKKVKPLADIIGTPADNPDANGTLFARQNKNVDDIDELSDAVMHIQDAQTETDKTVTQHTADISTLQTAVKTKANLVDGKVSSEELPIVTSLKQDDYTTIPSAKLVDEALTAVGNTLEEKINNKVVGLLHWQGVKSTTSEIKSITSAKKGDVWHSNGDGSEWVCTQDITAANADAWTELGTPVNLSGYYTKTEVDKKVKPLADIIGTPADNPDANGTLFARQNKNVDDIDELSDAVMHIQDAQTETDKTVTQHTADISTLQTAVKTKANLVDGKVSSEELPIVTSLKQDDYTTIPSAKLVDEALTAVGNTLEEKINNKVVGLLHWQGVKSTTSEIKSITSAKKGDVWHSNEDGSEWVCTEDISTVNDSAWTELGTPIDLGGYYTKNEVDKKVKPLADSIGTDSDAASANGSLYARIKKNATDISTNTANINATKEKVSGLDTKVTANTEAIATKASNSDLAALQSKVELKANQSDIPTAVQLVVKTI